MKKVSLIHTCVFIIAFFGMLIQSHSQILNSSFKRKANIVTGATLTAEDRDTTGGQDTNTYCEYTTIIDLKYEADQHTISAYYPMWTYQVVFKIMNANDTTQYTNDTLKIMHTPYPADCKYYDVKEYTTNWKKAKIRVLSVCGTSGTSMTCLSAPQSYAFLPTDIEMELFVKTTKIKKMLDVNTSMTYLDAGTAFELELVPVGTTFDCWWQSRYIEWTNGIMLNAVEYELEWVYIPESLYVQSAGAYFNTYADTPGEYQLAFTLAEPVRVTTKDNFYPFPEEYPDEGKLYFRVRPVGRLINTTLEDYDQPAFYPWSATVALGVEAITFSDDKNWQRVTTFAEEGKHKKVISYYDGIYRSRQSLTHISTDNTVIVAESLYDHEGRGVIQMLPYPEECQDLSYKPDRRKDMGGSDWNKYDFELTSATNGHEVNTTVGSSRYYSPSNPFMSTVNIYEADLYTPDAEKFPYTRVEYMMDGTGRVAKSSGVGPNHKLGSGHETKYYYSNPLQQELTRLFGSNVGQENHYKKNYVMDANGQLSTSYIDQEGRVVATALVGNSPNSLMELSSAVTETLTVDLSDKNKINGNLSTLAFKQFNAVAGSSYTFKYRIPYSYFESPTQVPCLACIYKLEVRIEGPGMSNYVHTATISPGSIPGDCIATGTYYEWTHTIALPEIGDYFIYKTLVWDENAALASVTSNMITNSASVLANLEASYLSQIDINDCDPYLQNSGHTYNGDAFATVVDMECQGMLHEMMNQVSPGGYYFEDSDPGAPVVYPDIDPYTSGSQTLFDLINSGYAQSFTLVTETLNLELKYADNTVVSQSDASNRAWLIANWRYEWGAILAKCLHPEICHFDQCMRYAKPNSSTINETTSSVYYDLNMIQVPKMSAEYTGSYSKYLNPQSNSPVTDIKPFYEDPFSSSNYSTATTNVMDPWPDGLPGTTEVTDLKNNYLKPYQTHFGLDYSIWEFSHPSQTYGTTPSISPIDAGLNGRQGNYLLFSSNYSLDATGDTMLWDLYRGSYLQAKTGYRYDPARLAAISFRGHACNILSIPDKVVTGNPDLPGNETEIGTMGEDVLDNLDMTSNSLGSLLSPGTMGDLCYENCENKADMILNNLLGNCISLYEIHQWLNFQDVTVNPALAVVTEMNEFKLKMINYCMADCTPPLAYANITVSELNGIEGSGHPLYPAYQDLVSLETALQNCSLFVDCPSMIDGNIIETAGDPVLTPYIVTNCNNIDCFENIPSINSDLVAFANSILATTPNSSFSIGVPSSTPVCTYCGCMPATNTVVVDPLTRIENYPSSACVSLTKNCPLSVACSTMYNVGGTTPNNNYGTATGAAPTTYHYLFPQNITDCVGNCYVKFFTATASLADLSTPTGIHKPLPASVITSITGLTNIIQTGPRTFTAYCTPTMTSPYSLTQYNTYYLAQTTPETTCTAKIAVEIKLDGCGPTLVCAPETTYTINGSETYDYQDWQEDCIDQLEEAALANAHAEFDYWVSQQVTNVMNNFQAACVKPGVETFTMQYLLKEHHYTLYYYDQADNLVQTVPPLGVHPVPASNFVVNTTNNTVIWNGTQPNHDLETVYQYNSLNQPIEQTTPDGGLSLFYYDDKGRITHSQNAQQRDDATATPSGGNTTVVAPYSRTIYDELGRIKQVSERTITFIGVTNTAFNDYPMAEGTPYAAGTGSNTEANNAPACSCFVDKQITRTYYDIGNYITAVHFSAENIRSRVAYSTFQEHDGTAYDIGTHYSYDIHGNVKTMVNEMNHLIHFGINRYKRTDYKYDLVSGKVNQVHYQPGQNDKFIHRYTYDADNRLTRAETSPDYLFYEMDAKYYYYLHGPLARMEIGERKVQGSDYAYTLHGWLKGVNAGFLTAQNDMGKDAYIPGSGSNPNKFVAQDAYGYVLDYYSGDYKANGAAASNYYTPVSAISGTDINNALYNTTAGLYNGNITRMYTALSSPDYSGSNPATDPNWKWEINGSAFHYDQLNRIRASKVFLATNSGSFASIAQSPKYNTEYTYDANGNILTLKRDGNVLYSSSYSMDNFTYSYYSNTNQLQYVDDAVTGNSGPNTPNFEYDYDNDLKDQAAGNYEYDKIGNLKKDVANDVTAIKWSVYGKVREVTFGSNSKPNLEFVYDASGQRVMKVSKPKDSGTGVVKAKNFWTYTIYSRDAQGNIMTIYTVKENTSTTKMELVQDEVPLYGSSRLGVWNANRLLIASPCSPELQYSTTNSSAITTCIPVATFSGQSVSIPASPVSLAGSSPSGFILTNIFNSTINVAKYQIGTSTNTGGWNGNITSVTLGSLSANKIKGTPVIGKKQYEFTDHLGNVLVTLSDTKKGMETGTPDGTAEYYQARILTTTDYYPFGMPMPGRYTTNQTCSTVVVPETTMVDVVNLNFNTPSITYRGPANDQRMCYDSWIPEYGSYINNETESGSDKWVRIESQDDSYGMRKTSGTLSLNTNYDFTFDLNLGTASSVIVDIYHANSSGVIQGGATTNTYSTGGSKTITYNTGATYPRIVIVIRQSNNAATKYFYIDNTKLKLTSGLTVAFDNNFDSPAVTTTGFSTLKDIYDLWTPWSHSECYEEVESGSDKWIKTYTLVSNHGIQNSYTGLTPNTTYYIDFQFGIGNCSSVSVIVWDWNGSAWINERTLGSTLTASGSVSRSFTTNAYDRVLIQIRRTSGTTSVYFYLDDLHIYKNVIGTVYQVQCSGGDSYRFGFNGQEKDNEVYGEGNSYTAEFWEYDPRLGRRWNRDPIPVPSESHYACFRGNPIRYSDPNGDWPPIGFEPIMFNPVQVMDCFSQAVSYGVAMNQYCNNAMINFALEVSGANLIDRTNKDLNERMELEHRSYTKRGEMYGEVYEDGGSFYEVDDALKIETMQSNIKLTADVMDWYGMAIGGLGGEVAATKGAATSTGKMGVGVLRSTKVDIALGLDNYVDNFSKSVGAPHSKQWEILGMYDELSFKNKNFTDAFNYMTEKVQQSGGRIKFDLTGLNVMDAIKTGGAGPLYNKNVANYTNWEFVTILKDSKLLNTTDFYLNGKIVDKKYINQFLKYVKI